VIHDTDNIKGKDVNPPHETMWFARCSCGWFGVKRYSPHEASDDAMEHRIAQDE
jgi:hypothetical protein